MQFYSCNIGATVADCEGSGDLRLAALPAKIQSIVDLLGFSQVIKVLPTTDEAVRSFES